MAYFHPLKIFHLFGFPSWKSSDPSKMCFSLIFKHKYSYSIARCLISAMREKWKLFFRHCDATKNAFQLKSYTTRNWSRFGKKSVEMGARGKWEVYDFTKKYS